MTHGPILDGDIAERDRLRAVNAKLLEALEGMVATVELLKPSMPIRPSGALDAAREAIEEAKK